MVGDGTAGGARARAPEGAKGRRALLRGGAGLLALGGAGCGFRPMYGGAGGAPSVEADIAAELAAVRVGFVAERFGQLVRRALETRLDPVRGTPVPARYELQAGPIITGEALGFLPDATATRVRYIATANWSLRRLPGLEIVANGFERTIEAYNVLPNQTFATDLSRDAAERRLAETLAEEIVLRLVIRLRQLRAGGGPQLIDPVEVSPPITDPSLAPIAPGSRLMQVPTVEGGLGGGIGTLDSAR